MTERPGTRHDVLFVNPSSGDGKGPDARELKAEAERRGVHVVVLGTGDDLAALAREHAPGATSLGTAGGDGSLGCVADQAMRAGIPFVCVPFGTRNHFALDLGLDRDDPLAALAAYSDRHERAVDVGVVGDHVVMNNVAFGVYAEVVHSDAYRDSKIRESAKVTRELLRGDRDPDAVTVVDPDGVAHRSPFALVVANNPYGTNLGRSGFGRREALDRGLLEVSVVDADSGWDLASLLWAATFSDTTDHDTFVQWTTTEIELDAEQPEVHAGIDGEAVILTAPIRIRSCPAALRVLVPAEAAVAERSS